MNKIFLFFLLLVGGCHRVPDKIEPRLSYAVQDRFLKGLPSAFEPLSPEEQSEGWGREYQIALGFAHELDLYQAITCFRRALILAPVNLRERRFEMYFEIVFCYYLAKKYSEVIDTFEHSPLSQVERDSPASCDLLIMLFDSYKTMNENAKAAHILQLITAWFPQTAQELILSTALSQANLPVLREKSAEVPALKPLLDAYQEQKKSIGKAQGFNALLPGAGYLYLGQKQTALTAFVLNGLFIGAAAYCFQKGNIPAGMIFTTFETGWYFGGILGAGLEAKYYNEKLYEQKVTPFMHHHHLFPVLMLRHAF